MTSPEYWIRGPLQRWLKERGATRCPSCGGDHHYGFKNPVSLSIPESGPDVKEEILVAPVVCKHCGHVRFFAVDVLAFGELDFVCE